MNNIGMTNYAINKQTKKLRNAWVDYLKENNYHYYNSGYKREKFLKNFFLFRGEGMELKNS
jgi:hypothetical protein